MLPTIRSHARPVLGALICLGSLLATAARADEASTVRLDGGYFLDPSIDAGRLYTSNFFYQAANRRSADAYVVRPVVHLGRDMPGAQVLLSVLGNLAWYNIPGVESYYNDGQFDARGYWIATDRNRLSGFATRSYSHDPLGTGRTETFPAPNRVADRWTLDSFSGSYRFGAPYAMFNIELGAQRDDKRYINNQALTRYLDYTLDTFSYTLFYNFSAKTSALLDARYGETHFTHSTVPDAGETRIKAGITWQAAAKTKGDLRLGYARREFHHSGVAPENLFDWGVTLTWTPLTTSTVVLSANRDSAESYLSSTAVINNRSFDLKWTQVWTSRFKTELSGQYLDSDFIGTARHDHLAGFGPSASYALLRFLELKLSLNRQIRSSNVTGVDYNGNLVYVGLSITP